MNTKYIKQRIESIALDRIAPADYQRPTCSTQVKDIAAKFDMAKLGMPVVSERDGHYYLLDGAHRVAALRELEFSHATFIVLEGLTYEEEAAYFMRQNENMRPLTRFNLYKAGLEAKNELYVNIERIVRANGYIVSGSAKNPNAISAIHALETVAAVYGYVVLFETLVLIRQTWDGIKNATNREFIVGVADFVDRFGTVDFAERMRVVNIGSILHDYNARIFSFNKSSSDPIMRRTFCRVLVEHYNHGLGSRSKKRLYMEE